MMHVQTNMNSVHANELSWSVAHMIPWKSTSEPIFKPVIHRLSEGVSEQASGF